MNTMAYGDGLDHVKNDDIKHFHRIAMMMAFMDRADWHGAIMNTMAYGDGLDHVKNDDIKHFHRIAMMMAFMDRADWMALQHAFLELETD
jgi:hypothetical protein